MSTKTFEYRVMSGKLHHDGAVYRPGARFRTSLPVPAAFADCVQEIGSEPYRDEPKPRKQTYKLIEKGGGWFDVVREADGKKMNEKSLQGRDEALALIDQLDGKEA